MDCIRIVEKQENNMQFLNQKGDAFARDHTFFEILKNDIRKILGDCDYMNTETNDVFCTETTFINRSEKYEKIGDNLYELSI